MSFPEPQPALNPVNIEHRLTVVEQTTLSLVENTGNLARLIDQVSGHVERVERSQRAEADLRVKELAAVQDGMDALAQGIKDRATMEEARQAGFAAGQRSITVKLPWKQVGAIVATITAVLGGIEGLMKALL